MSKRIVLLLTVCLCLASGCAGDTKDAAEQETTEAVPEETTEAAEEEETDFSGGSGLADTEIKWLTMEVGATAEEVRLNWFSPSSAPGKAEWRNTKTGETVSLEADCKLSANREEYYVNKVSVTGLEPGVSYTYRVGNEDSWSPEYSYTVPADTGTLTFLVAADAQLGQSQTEEREVTAKRWDEVLTTALTAVPEAQLLLHLGDHVACFGSGRDYELFLDHRVLYSIPLAPVVGNHDVPNVWSIEQSGYPDGHWFYEQLNVPNLSELGETSPGTGDGDYYFMRGGVLFLLLNNECASPEEHEQFVAQVVAEHPEAQWRILAQHYPAFVGVESADAECKDWVISLAADYGIDLVLSGHEHAYSRSGIIDRDGQLLTDYASESGGEAVNPEGVLFVTCSTSSGCLYHTTAEQPELAVQGQPEEPMILKLDITDTELSLYAYLAQSWEVYDTYTIRKD